jgi:hypothetical protein
MKKRSGRAGTLHHHTWQNCLRIYPHCSTPSANRRQINQLPAPAPAGLPIAVSLMNQTSDMPIRNAEHFSSFSDR